MTEIILKIVKEKLDDFSYKVETIYGDKITIVDAADFPEIFEELEEDLNNQICKMTELGKRLVADGVITEK